MNDGRRARQGMREAWSRPLGERTGDAIETWNLRALEQGFTNEPPPLPATMPRTATEKEDLTPAGRGAD